MITAKNVTELPEDLPADAKVAALVAVSSVQTAARQRLKGVEAVGTLARLYEDDVFSGGIGVGLMSADRPDIVDFVDACNPDLPDDYDPGRHRGVVAVCEVRDVVMALKSHRAVGQTVSGWRVTVEIPFGMEDHEPKILLGHETEGRDSFAYVMIGDLPDALSRLNERLAAPRA